MLYCGRATTNNESNRAIEAPLLLLMLSYCLDTTYPHGTNSMYCFLEVGLLGMKPKKVPSVVDRMLTCLK